MVNLVVPSNPSVKRDAALTRVASYFKCYAAKMY